MVTEAFLLTICTIATVSFSHGWHGWWFTGSKGFLHFWEMCLRYGRMDDRIIDLLSLFSQNRMGVLSANE